MYTVLLGNRLQNIIQQNTRKTIMGVWCFVLLSDISAPFVEWCKCCSHCTSLQDHYVKMVNLILVASAWKCTYSHFTICPMTKNKMVALTHSLILCTLLLPLLVFRVESEVSRERDSQILWKFSKIFCTHFLVLSVSDMLLMMAG